MVLSIQTVHVAVVHEFVFERGRRKAAFILCIKF